MHSQTQRQHERERERKGRRAQQRRRKVKGAATHKRKMRLHHTDARLQERKQTGARDARPRALVLPAIAAGQANAAFGNGAATSEGMESAWEWSCLDGLPLGFIKARAAAGGQGAAAAESVGDWHAKRWLWLGLPVTRVWQRRAQRAQR